MSYQIGIPASLSGQVHLPVTSGNGPEVPRMLPPNPSQQHLQTDGDAGTVQRMIQVKSTQLHLTGGDGSIGQRMIPVKPSQVHLSGGDGSNVQRMVPVKPEVHLSPGNFVEVQTMGQYQLGVGGNEVQRMYPPKHEQYHLTSGHGSEVPRTLPLPPKPIQEPPAEEQESSSDEYEDDDDEVQEGMQVNEEISTMYFDLDIPNFPKESETRKFYCCKICFNLSSTEDEIKEHMKGHADKKLDESGATTYNRPTDIKIINSSKCIFPANDKECFTCSLCMKDYRLARMRISAEEKSAICDVCEHSLSMMKSAQPPAKKRRIRITPKPYKCDHCSRCFGQKVALRRHIECVHTGQKFYTCDRCQVAFSLNANLKKHMKSVHNGDVQFPCDTCGKIFNRQDNLRKHVINIHMREKIHKCPECDEMFALQEFLRRHVRRVHMPAKPHICDVCGKDFEKKHKMLQHKSTVHHGERPHACHLCEKTYSQKVHLKCHIDAIHNKVRPFICRECGATFTSKGNLGKHYKSMHDENKSYKCECGKTFGEQSRLNRHIKTVHAEEDLIACLVCQKTFNADHKLKRHMKRSHSGKATDVRNESVSDAEPSEVETRKSRRKRKTPVNLKDHVSEEDEIMFECEVCEKAFNSGSKLKRHMTMSHGHQFSSDHSPKRKGKVSAKSSVSPNESKRSECSPVPTCSPDSSPERNVSRPVSDVENSDGVSSPAPNVGETSEPASADADAGSSSSDSRSGSPALKVNKAHAATKYERSVFHGSRAAIKNVILSAECDNEQAGSVDSESKPDESPADSVKLDTEHLVDPKPTPNDEPVSALKPKSEPASIPTPSSGPATTPKPSSESQNKPTLRFEPAIISAPISQSARSPRPNSQPDDSSTKSGSMDVSMVKSHPESNNEPAPVAVVDGPTLTVPVSDPMPEPTTNPDPTDINPSPSSGNAVSSE